MSERKVDVREYLPISAGWLKMAPIELVFFFWVGLVVWSYYTHPPHWGGLLADNENLFMFILIAVLFPCLLMQVLFLAGSGRRLFHFVRSYFKNNVVGRTAYFYYQNETLKFSIDTLVGDDWQENQVAWKLVLGGWFNKAKPRLLVWGHEESGPRQWQRASWNIELYDSYGNHFEDCGSIRVYVRDYVWSRLRTNLKDGLKRFSEESENAGSLDGVFTGYPAAIAEVSRLSKLIDQLEALAESAISDIEDTPRFGKSGKGREIKLGLDAQLTALLPDRKRRYEDQVVVN